jgi:acyl carrier protein
VSLQFAAVLRTDSQVDAPCGLVGTYGSSDRDGWTYISSLIRPGLQGSGVALEACALLIDYVFRNWNYRKIYAEVPAYNQDAVLGAMDRYMEHVATLPDHLYFHNEHHDLLIYAVDRDIWERARDADDVLVGIFGLRSHRPPVLTLDEFTVALETRFSLRQEVRPEMSVSGLDFAADSLGVLELVTFLEEAAESAIDPSELRECLRTWTVRDLFLEYCARYSAP